MAMKLIAFIQMYNEAEKGNLVRCLENVRQWADDICIYDDASTLLSVEIAKRFTKHIIQGERNEFHKELYHKQQLLEYALGLSPDWIMWIDCDEIMDREAVTGGLRRLMESAPEDADAFSFRQLNLWRSQTYARTDSLFSASQDTPPPSHKVRAGWFCRLWRVTPEIRFHLENGIHCRLYPVSIKAIHAAPFQVIHYGFCDYKRLLAKIGAHTWDLETFRRLGPGNWILNETQCECVRVPEETFPVENVPSDVWPRPEPTEAFTAYNELEEIHPLSIVAGEDSSELWYERHHDDYHGTYTDILDRNRTSYIKNTSKARLCMFTFSPVGKRIVDIGCGGGWYALDCIANGAKKVYCLEINQQIIDHAKHSFAQLEVPESAYEFIHVPTQMELPAGSIDIVYCMTVFMHIPLCEVIAYLAWIHTILSDTGEAHLQFHQVDGTTLFRSDGMPEHSYRIPDNSVDAMIEEAGLIIASKRYPRGETLEPVWTLYVCKRRPS